MKALIGPARAEVVRRRPSRGSARGRARSPSRRRRSPRDRAGGGAPSTRQPPTPPGAASRHARESTRRGRPLLRSCRPLTRAFSRYGQHQATEEARPDRRPPAAREPALPLDDQDADEAAGERCRRTASRRGRRPSIASSCAGSTAPLPAERCTATPPRARSRRRRGWSPASAPRPPGRAAARHVDERTLQLEIAGEARAALERVVELGEANRRVAQLVLGVKPPPAARASARSTGAASGATRPPGSSSPPRGDACTR